MRAYHFLKDDMTAGNGTEPAWAEGEERTLPDGIELVICEVGYHSSPTPFDALQYARGSVLCLVEIGDPTDSQPDKYVSRSRKLIRAVRIDRQLREFACDVAEEALNLEVQRGRTVDERSCAAIEVVRRFAQGSASSEELAAARDAAWDAARDAAWAAARDAARAAARDAAWDAARAAARDAAWDAAWDAARAAAWDAARDAQKAKFNALVEPLFTAVLS